MFAVTGVPVPTVSLDGGAIPAGTTPAEALHDRGVDALGDLADLSFFERALQDPEPMVRRAAASVPSQQITNPECWEKPMPTPPP